MIDVEELNLLKNSVYNLLNCLKLHVIIINVVLKINHLIHVVMMTLSGGRTNEKSNLQVLCKAWHLF